MPINFPCPNPDCQRNLKGRDEHAGRTLPCPACKTPVTVPDVLYQSRFEDIFEAAKVGTVEDVKYFVENKGVDINVKDDDDWTPLSLAAKHNSDVDVLKYLISKCNDVKTKSSTGRTLLHFAAQSNSNVDVLKYLISQGINANSKNQKGLTPLHDAAGSNANIGTLQYLISQGTDVHIQDNTGQTPLHIAARDNPSVEVLIYLISQGAEVNAKAYDGTTPLHLAAQRSSNVEVLKYLIAKEANVNAKDMDGLVPFHNAACKNPNVAILEFFISLGANVNETSDAGMTPLLGAAFGNPSIEVLQYLIAKGADVNAKIDGNTVMDVANTEEKKRVLREAAKSHAAKPVPPLVSANKNTSYTEKDTNLLGNELAQIEAVVDECEKMIENGRISVDQIVTQLRSIADPTSQFAKCNEWIGILVEQSNKINILQLIELKHQYPGDPRIARLGRRAAKCFLMLNDIGLSVSEALVSPDLRPGMQAQNQEMRNGLKELVASLVSS